MSSKYSPKQRRPAAAYILDQQKLLEFRKRVGLTLAKIDVALFEFRKTRCRCMLRSASGWWRYTWARTSVWLQFMAALAIVLYGCEFQLLRLQATYFGTKPS